MTGRVLPELSIRVQVHFVGEWVVCGDSFCTADDRFVTGFLKPILRALKIFGRVRSPKWPTDFIDAGSVRAATRIGPVPLCILHKYLRGRAWASGFLGVFVTLPLSVLREISSFAACAFAAPPAGCAGCAGFSGFLGGGGGGDNHALRPSLTPSFAPCWPVNRATVAGVPFGPTCPR